MTNPLVTTRTIVLETHVQSMWSALANRNQNSATNVARERPMSGVFALIRA